MARVRVDRFEGDLAVLEWEGRALELPRALLPAEAREGDVLAVDLKVDAEATREARRAIAERRGRLGRSDDGGDFSL